MASAAQTPLTAEEYWAACGESLYQCECERCMRCTFTKTRVTDVSRVWHEPAGTKSPTPHLSRALRISLELKWTIDKTCLSIYNKLNEPTLPQLTDEILARFRATGAFAEYDFDMPYNPLVQLACCHELVRRAIEAKETTIGDGVRITLALNALEREHSTQYPHDYMEEAD